MISVEAPFLVAPFKCNFYGFLCDFIKKRILKGLIFNFRSKRRHLKDIRRIRAKTRQNRANYGRWWFFMSTLPSAWSCRRQCRRLKSDQKLKNDVAVLHGHLVRPCRRPCWTQKHDQKRKKGFFISIRARAQPCRGLCRTSSASSSINRRS